MADDQRQHADSVSQQALNRLAKEFIRVGSEPLDEPVPVADDMREQLLLAEVRDLEELLIDGGEAC